MTFCEQEKSNTFFLNYDHEYVIHGLKSIIHNLSDLFQIFEKSTKLHCKY
jgi:hypothetical protein